MLKLWTSRAHVPRKNYCINGDKIIKRILPFDIKGKGRSNAIKTPAIGRASQGQSGCNETTRLSGLRYAYLSFEHKVLEDLPKEGFFYTHAAVLKAYL